MQNSNSVLILYPWGIDSVINKNIGAGLRVRLLADFMKGRGYTVTVVSVGLRFQNTLLDGIYYRQLRYPSNLLLTLLYSVALVSVKILRSQALRALLYFEFHRLDGDFYLQIKRLMGVSSHVFLEYPFWFTIVDGRRTILTDYDVIAESWGGKGRTLLSSLFRKMLLQREIEAFHHCKHSVVVSESDRDFFCVHGITDLRVITNPVKLPDFIKNPIREQGDKPHEPGSSALFIGSSWYPNLQAAQNIVNHIAPYCPNIHFFIAGACSLHLGRHPSNVTYLGRISSEVLDQYYRDVTYALVPLAVGTGTSLKTVEAMAYGKVVISTSIGVRGIAFENGVHGIICDEISRFHQILHSLEHDIHKKLLLSRNAMLLARNYDYQHVFEQYLDMMHDMEVRENVSMVVPETCE